MALTDRKLRSIRPSGVGYQIADGQGLVVVISP